jgi:hypothetical protein
VHILYAGGFENDYFVYEQISAEGERPGRVSDSHTSPASYREGFGVITSSRGAHNCRRLAGCLD